MPCTSLCFRIAGISVALTSGDPDLELAIEGDSGKFLVEDRNPDVRVLATWGDVGGVSRGRKVFDSGGLWRLYRESGAHRFSFTSPVLGALPYKEAVFRDDFTSGEVILSRRSFCHSPAVSPLQYPLDELLFQNLLARGRGVEVHACGIVDPGGRGLLFPGFSGAGKSTLAGLWKRCPGTTILSDDRIILRKMDGGIRMYGTPWHGEGELSSTVQASLDGIYFLRHGERNFLKEMAPMESAARLFAASFPPFHSARGIEFTLGFLEELVETVPCCELAFTPDEGVIELIREGRSFSRSREFALAI